MLQRRLDLLHTGHQINDYQCVSFKKPLTVKKKRKTGYVSRKSLMS